MFKFLLCTLIFKFVSESVICSSLVHYKTIYVVNSLKSVCMMLWSGIGPLSLPLIVHFVSGTLSDLDVTVSWWGFISSCLTFRGGGGCESFRTLICIAFPMNAAALFSGGGSRAAIITCVIATHNMYNVYTQTSGHYCMSTFGTVTTWKYC